MGVRNSYWCQRSKISISLIGICKLTYINPCTVFWLGSVRGQIFAWCHFAAPTISKPMKDRDDFIVIVRREKKIWIICRRWRNLLLFPNHFVGSMHMVSSWRCRPTVRSLNKWNFPRVFSTFPLCFVLVKWRRRLLLLLLLLWLYSGSYCGRCAVICRTSKSWRGKKKPHTNKEL